MERRRNGFTARATGFVTVGVLAQVHGSHLPIRLSQALVIGGMAMLAVDRFLPIRRRTPAEVRDLERSAGLNPMEEL